MTRQIAAQELRDLGIRRGKASMDWYRAMRARYQGEMTARVRSEVRRVLTEHIRYVLERQLKSVDFVRLVSKL